MPDQSRIRRIRAVLIKLHKQADVYAKFLKKHMAGGEGGQPDKEPPPIAIATMNLVQTEIEELHREMFGDGSVPKHLYEPLDPFMDEHYKTYDGSESFFGKTPPKLAHYYIGLTCWIDKTLTYLTYIEGSSESTSDYHQTKSPDHLIETTRHHAKPTATSPSRTNVFVSYSHKDEKWRKRLVTQIQVLARERLVDIWDDRKIGAGEDWFKEIDTKMLDARIAVLLISADFLTSSFIRDHEIPKLFDRHESGGMSMFPLLVRSCAWEEVPWLARMQIRPIDAKPVSRYRGDKVDEVLAQVVREIAAIARGAKP